MSVADNPFCTPDKDPRVHCIHNPRTTMVSVLLSEMLGGGQVTS
jgi:hypothetical protein